MSPNPALALSGAQAGHPALRDVQALGAQDFQNPLGTLGTPRPRKTLGKKRVFHPEPSPANFGK